MSAEVRVDDAQGGIEDRVVAVARELARELGGNRAASVVTAEASLERQVGLGSLERVELMMRLERELGRELDERFLLLDTLAEIAREAMTAPVRESAPVARGQAQPAAAPLCLDDVTTLVQALERRATAEPNRTHVLLLTDAGQQRITYAELWDGAARIAQSLQERGVKRGDPVAIMLPTSLDYLQSFMGVLAAGGIAVPLYPPFRLDRLAEYLHRQSSILVNANARVMISMEEAVPVAAILRHTAPALEAIVTADGLRSGAAPLASIAGEARDAALIQYTSGSTGDPKGVLLTNANLLSNIRSIIAGVQLTPVDAVVSWLPLYHDMGLIGVWLNAMVNGIPLTLMSPLTFLARPERWLWAIHEQRATLSPAPNFAYELCVRKIRNESLAGLDLSSWRLASNGAEPVSAATLDRFANRFAPFGMRREALFPVYGLAECSVALCFPPVGREPLVDTVSRPEFEQSARASPATAGAVSPLKFVSVGKPLAGHDVRLLDSQGQAVGDRIIGRLSFRGPSCTSGYYRNPGATAQAISPDGWVDSGDLAYRADGELFITGRVKDLIIKGGRNMVPQEIEEVVGAVDGIRKGCVAAFGVTEETTGTERLVVLAESRATSASDRARLERDVVTAVATGVGIPPDVVRIVAPGTVPKTPSGKIRRAAAKEAYEGGHIGRRPRVPLMLRATLVLGIARSSARVVVRGLRLACLFLICMVALVLLGPAIGVLLYVLPVGRPVRKLGRIVARGVIALSGCRVHVDGREHLPHAGPAVLVTNHTSYVDSIILLAALPVDFVFVAMTEILSWPLVGVFTRKARYLTVDRWNSRQSLADAAVVEQRLRAGDSVLFFSEGGFSRARGLRPFRLGAFDAAASLGVSVTPMALRGSREILPADSWLPQPGRVHVWIGEPLRPAGRDWIAVLDLRERTSAAIAVHCGEPRMPDGPRA